MTRWLAATCLLAGCASSGSISVEEPSGVVADTSDVPPAGYGTLRQEDVALRLRSGPLEIRVIPLDEHVIRLLAPDTYASLHRLRLDRMDAVAAAAQRYGLSAPTLFVVTFFGLQERTRFDPELLTITAQNRLFRPLEILPLSPLWSGRQLGQRETATAVYVFGDGIRVLDPFAVSYPDVTNRQWEQILRTLHRERASVLARAGRP
jgi:hypothetical protein